MALNPEIEGAGPRHGIRLSRDGEKNPLVSFVLHGNDGEGLHLEPTTVEKSDHSQTGHQMHLQAAGKFLHLACADKMRQLQFLQKRTDLIKYRCHKVPPKLCTVRDLR